LENFDDKRLSVLWEKLLDKIRLDILSYGIVGVQTIFSSWAAPKYLSWSTDVAWRTSPLIWFDIPFPDSCLAKVLECEVVENLTLNPSAVPARSKREKTLMS
jgi:hypothetical protein